MRVRIATMWFDEEDLAPLFLRHYDSGLADEIRIVLDADTRDGTREKVADWLASPNRPGRAEIHLSEHRFARGLDDEEKARVLSEIANRPGCDVAVAVDADEFLFAWVEAPATSSVTGRSTFTRPAIEESPVAAREKIQRLQDDADIAWVPMWNVYRNRGDTDVDPVHPPLPQRRHGDPRVHHAKPCVFRAGIGVDLGPGEHSFTGPAKLRQAGWARPGALGAAHWQMADPDLTVRRLANRRARLSPENLARRHGTHYLEMSEAAIRAACEEHLDDPRIF